MWGDSRLSLAQLLRTGVELRDAELDDYLTRRYEEELDRTLRVHSKSKWTLFKSEKVACQRRPCDRITRQSRVAVLGPRLRVKATPLERFP
jgi:hypothetical protein